MSLKPLAKWVPIEDLLDLPLHERIKYVRENLPSPKETSRNGYMSHDDFGALLGAKRHSPIRWEKEKGKGGSSPRDYAEKIAALTPYPPAALGAPGEAELLRGTFARRLQELVETVGDLLEEQKKTKRQLDRLRAQVRNLEAPPAAGASGTKRPQRSAAN